VADRLGVTPSDAAEWYFLVSTGTPVLGTVNTLNHGFTPVPFGNDLFFQFGNKFSLPIVGNFDPPVVASTLLPGTNQNNKLDVNNDGRVSAFDALQIIDRLNQSGPTAVPSSGFIRAPFMDVDGSKMVTAFDAIQVINYLNLNPIGSGGEEVSWHAPEAVEEEDLLTMLAIEQVGRRKENNASHQ
jgi:hypothetical protein